MSSLFLALASQSFGALDTTFGELITISPQKPGEFIAAGPSSTPAYVATGIFDLNAVIDEAMGGEKTGARSEVVTTSPTVEFPFTAFGIGAPFPLVGWHVSVQATPLRPPPLNFVIVSRLPDGDDGRVRFQLRPLP